MRFVILGWPADYAGQLTMHLRYAILLPHAVSIRIVLCRAVPCRIAPLGRLVPLLSKNLLLS